MKNCVRYTRLSEAVVNGYKIFDSQTIIPAGIRIYNTAVSRAFIVSVYKGSGFAKKSQQYLRIPLKIHFGGRANLFVASLRQTKAALSTDKADLSSLSASKNLLLAVQKQLFYP